MKKDIETNENNIVTEQEYTYCNPVESYNPADRKKKGSWVKYTAAVVAGMIAGAAAFGCGMQFANNTSDTYKPAVSYTTEGASYISDTEAISELSVVDIAKKSGSSVVGIISRSTYTTFFGTKTSSEGSGSGIIATDNGYIITNAHVIEGAESISVVLSADTEEHPATVVGVDSKTDLAVIKVDLTGLPEIEIGTSSNLEVGELAVAIGNPMGQEFAGSVTVGVISALNRTLNVEGRQYNLIQTDAAINPGNSGGALLNKYGQLIGINSVKIASDGYEGMGFAIPIDEALPIIEQLMDGGYVRGRPLIGITPRDITYQMSAAYNLPVGVYVTGVSVNSCAEKAGLMVGDVIVKADGVVVTTTDELNNLRDKHKAGEQMTLQIIRGNETINVALILDENKPVGK